MKHLKIAFIVIAVCAVAWCGLRIYAKHFYNKEPQAEYFYLSEIPVKPSQFEADFEEIHQIVMENDRHFAPPQHHGEAGYPLGGGSGHLRPDGRLRRCRRTVINECSFMRLNTLEKLYNCLKDESPEIIVDPEIAEKAVKPIKRMLEISAKLGL